MTTDQEKQKGAGGALNDAMEREAATREILQVISQSRDDEQPVFDAILKNAASLCDAPMARLHLADPERTHFHLAAAWGEDLRSIQPGDRYPLDGTLIVSQTILESRTIHLTDLAESQLYRDRNPVAVRLVEEEGIRTRVTVPLVSGALALGCITLSRREVKPFTEDQIALVETFAAQAVIAIENVRQFRELQTRLEREVATSNILEVISRSREDEHQVFDVIFESLMRLCNTPQASLFLVSADEDHLEFVASRGPGREALDRYRRDNPIPLSDEHSIFVRAFKSREPVHVNDVQTESRWQPDNDELREAATSAKIRSTIMVPLVSGQKSLGVLAAYRTEIRPFSDDEIALHRTFAAQAVIAIENVRQFRELQTRLEREAATRSILQVISQSRDDEKPVFEVILKNIAKLCKTGLATLSLVNAEKTHLEYAAHWGIQLKTFDLGKERWPLEGNLQITTSVREGRIIHTADLSDTDLYREGDSTRVRIVDIEGVRSYLTVPLFAGDGDPIGCIGLYRQEVKPFSDDEIALVEGFAAQAVIAIENVRQFKALQARTAEVQALNASLENRVAAQVDELERMGRLKRFLSPQVADAVLSSGDDKLLSSHRAMIATLFCDMRGFTAFCETAEPEEAIEVLQAYHEEMGALIANHGAGVDHRSGDGIMVIFNDPLPCDHPAGDAVRLALAMRERMAGLCADWRKLGHRLGFGVGISLGYATVGVVGSAGRYDYTASGTAVNLAARLCDQAGDGEILLSPRAFKAVEDTVETEPAGELTLKGIQAPVSVVRVLRLR